MVSSWIHGCLPVLSRGKQIGVSQTDRQTYRQYHIDRFSKVKFLYRGGERREKGLRYYVWHGEERRRRRRDDDRNLAVMILRAAGSRVGERETDRDEEEIERNTLTANHSSVHASINIE